MLKAVRFRIQNFRNIEDSGWIPIERVTAFVGRNESGKTTLLKGLHKFNPATPEPYNPQREFPRDRYTRDFKEGKNWPVCSVAFEISGELRRQCEIEAHTADVPTFAIFTRYYDGNLTLAFEPALSTAILSPQPVLDALAAFERDARRLQTPSSESEEGMQKIRGDLATWASAWAGKISKHQDLKSQAALLDSLAAEANGKSSPATADLVEHLQSALKPVLLEAKSEALHLRLSKILTPKVPVFIYFENYGILDSAIYLPRFIEDLAQSPNDPRVRTIQAMFKHVSLEPQDVADLGNEQAEAAKARGEAVTQELIAKDQERKELRAVKLNAASLDISKRFSDWWLQRRHEISYGADGNYFRIWVSDDRRPGVKIELESRSKGFQWFFSFYLVFLVESEGGYKDAILLLDEPGLNLHPTAQQGLISFFEKLAEKNPILYSTHSPFLIDGEHIHRVRPVTEDETGHSHVSIGECPPLRSTATDRCWRYSTAIAYNGCEECFASEAVTMSPLRSLRIALQSMACITGISLASPASADPAGITLYVAVQGSLQGADKNNLPAIFVSEMNRAPEGVWRFAPADSVTESAPNRIEWRLIPGSDASGEVRTFGFSRAMMTRLMGSHRSVEIEARLFLNNAYDTMVSGQIKDWGNPHDDDVVSEIALLTKQLMSNASFNTENTAPPPRARS